MIKCYRHTKEFIEPILNSVYFISFILALSAWSLISGDLYNYMFKDSDGNIFSSLNEFMFFFFLFDFLLSTTFEKNFIGSFFFYIDFISLLSCIPDVKLIWNPIAELISGDDLDPGDISSNSSLQRAGIATSAGSTYTIINLVRQN